MEKDNRKNYWNKAYVDYWKGKVQQSNESLDITDPTSTDKTYLRMIDMLDINKRDTVLDVGCGYGRSLPYLASSSKKVIGIDISYQMIEEAKKITHSYNNIILQIAESESMDLDDNLVDKVICFAAFDAMHQNKALVEFNRICKIGGKLLVTGKNNYFMNDDKEAKLAEFGARQKNHPNFFTDVSLLIESLHMFGFELEFEEYYLRRGDFSTDKIEKNMPEQFYEYMLLLKKINKPVNTALLPEISKSYSQKI